MIERHIEFLEEAAQYFESRPTKGEDRAYWANVFNAENCRKIAEYLRSNAEPSAKAMETGTAKTEGLGAKHDSAGRKALPDHLKESTHE